MSSKELQEDLQILSAYIESLNIGGNTVLITGATGLIGSLIIKAIINYNSRYEPRIRVIGMARNPDKIKAVFADEFDNKKEINSVKFIYQDICKSIPKYIRCDYIIHTANSTNSKYFITNPVEVIESIYTGTRQILEYAKSSPVKSIVYLSSMEVFGYVNNENRISESELGYLDIQCVRSCYSEGKRLAELMCKSYAEEYNLPVKIARLAQVFGAGILNGENRVFAQFARSAVKGEAIVLHTYGQSVGNYCYTRDALKALFLLLVNGKNGEVYTVVNEETTRTIAEMAQLVAEHFSENKSKVVLDIPAGNPFGYALDTKMKLSSKKLRELGWKPEVGLFEMYSRMIPDLM